MLAFCFLVCVFVLSIANGANDNFKGMATLWGSGTLSYKRALILANVATFLGGCLAIFLGGELLKTFSGKGIVGAEVLSDPKFALVFAFGAAFTVSAATIVKYPVSTTHAILGSLAGAAYAFSSHDANFGILFDKGFIPLLLSPLIAIALTFSLWRLSNVLLSGPTVAPLVGGAIGRDQMRNQMLAELSPSRSLDRAHMVSGFCVCFARGVNDTPKIASIFLIANSLQLSGAMIFISIAILMVTGGLFLARDVANVMSHEVTGMTPAQGFVGNIVTALLVIFASKFGLGVSTTHVSVGSLFGIGALSGQAKWRKIAQILAAWILTVPCGFGAALLIAMML